MTMGKVTQLHQVVPEPDPHVVETLQHLLDLAQQGRLAGIVYVGILPESVHVVGAIGVLDDRDVALAILDLQDNLTTRRGRKKREEP